MKLFAKLLYLANNKNTKKAFGKSFEYRGRRLDKVKKSTKVNNTIMNKTKLIIGLLALVSGILAINNTQSYALVFCGLFVLIYITIHIAEIITEPADDYFLRQLEKGIKKSAKAQKNLDNLSFSEQEMLVDRFIHDISSDTKLIKMRNIPKNK